MALIGLVLVSAGVAQLYAVVTNMSLADLWHALRDHGINGLATVVEQQRGARAANSKNAAVQLASLETGTGTAGSPAIQPATTAPAAGPPAAPGAPSSTGGGPFPGPLPPGQEVA